MGVQHPSAPPACGWGSSLCKGVSSATVLEPEVHCALANSSDKEQLKHRYWSESKTQVSPVPRVDFFGTEASLAS